MPGAVAPGTPDGIRLSASDLQWFSDLVYSVSGIVLGQAKSQLVHARLAKRVRLTGRASLADYMQFVANDPAEQEAAVYALTTNHTKFFREDHHFDHFAATAWPRMAEKLRRGESVRLWSAACSSGEEPYSLAMTALGPDRSHGLSVLRGDFRILATDLAPHVLKTAKAGEYPVDALSAMPAALKAAWVKRSGDRCEIDPAVRAAIAFRQLNLLGDWPVRRIYDAIFCRNVMIYFDEPTKARLLQRLSAQLAPEGFLYIGHSERLSGPAERELKAVGHTIYRKVSR
jgi:chemotaxis protein methyltransferase CheR